MSRFDELCQLVHGGSPYDGFDSSRFSLDLQGWNGECSFLSRAVEGIRPSMILEVGSWKGQSTATLFRAARGLGLDVTVVAVDTWLGALEFVDATDADHDLRRRHGYPTVYYQFLANMAMVGADRSVVPLPQTSLIATRFLESRGFKFDLVYLDASHEEVDVTADLEACWRLLRDGGVLCGDDHSSTWPGVVAALDEFCGRRGLAKVLEPGCSHWTVRRD